MELFQILAIGIYVIGFFLWFGVWHFTVGYEWLKKTNLMYLPFLGGLFTIFINIIFAFFASIPEYGVEIGIYGFVESNAKTIASFALGIAVFVVVTFKDTVELHKDESRQFLVLVFASFLFSVMGVLPLYWVPQNYGWLTTLRHLKTVPYLYSLFIFSAAMIIYIYGIIEARQKINASTKDEKSD